LPLQEQVADPPFSSGLSTDIEASPILNVMPEQVPSAPYKPADGPGHAEALHLPGNFTEGWQEIHFSDTKASEEGAVPIRDVFLSDQRAATAGLQAMPENQDSRWPALGESRRNRPKRRLNKRTAAYMKRRNERMWAAVVIVGLLAGWIFGFLYLGDKIETGKMAEDEPAIIPSKSVTYRTVRVEGGQFLMGSDAPDAAPEEQPVHAVVVPRFFISKYEVTIGQFRQFVKMSGYVTDAEKEGWSSVYKDRAWSKPNVKNGVNWMYDIAGNLIDSNVTDMPVVHVSWNDAINYCKWLSLQADSLYRLPTEEEWEYAARGGNSSQSFRFSGSHTPQGVAWYGGNSEGTLHPVGRKQPNELGIHDMSGNAMEWCASSYKQYMDSLDEVSPSRSEKVLRGGSWYYDEDWCRSTFRRGLPPNMRGGAIGFRVCREEKQRRL
jgi:formylglycine-generating enzyme required for sulfatase activity